METKVKDNLEKIVCGIAVGGANSLFGGGGGMVLLPLLSRWGTLDQKKAFATCVALEE